MRRIQSNSTLGNIAYGGLNGNQQPLGNAKLSRAHSIMRTPSKPSFTSTLSSWDRYHIPSIDKSSFEFSGARSASVTPLKRRGGSSVSDFNFTGTPIRRLEYEQEYKKIMPNTSFIYRDESTRGPSFEDNKSSSKQLLLGKSELEMDAIPNSRIRTPAILNSSKSKRSIVETHEGHLIENVQARYSCYLKRLANKK